jgi:hypothetical protein
MRSTPVVHLYSKLIAVDQLTELTSWPVDQ